MVPFGLSANFTNFNDSEPHGTKFPEFAGRAHGLSRIGSADAGLAYHEHSAIAIGPALVHTHLFYEQSISIRSDDGKTFGSRSPESCSRIRIRRRRRLRIARLLPEGRFRLLGTANTLGFRRWIHLQEIEAQDHFGFSFRSSVNNHLSGKRRFAFTSTGSVNVFLPNASQFQPVPRTRPRKGALRRQPITCSVSPRRVFTTC